MAETATWKRGRDPLPNNAADISAESHQRFYNNGERILPSYSVDFPDLHPISSEWSARWDSVVLYPVQYQANNQQLNQIPSLKSASLPEYNSQGEHRLFLNRGTIPRTLGMRKIR